MQKILFVNPINYSSIYFTTLLSRWPYLGAYQLARLTPEDIEVEIADEALKEFDPDAISDPPDFAAISVNFTAAAARGYKIADALRKRGIKVIIGGNHATYCSEEAKRHADSVVMGEADEIWETIIEDARKNNLQPLYQAKRLPDLGDIRFKRKNPLLDIPPVDFASTAQGLGVDMNQVSDRGEVLKSIHHTQGQDGILGKVIRPIQDFFFTKFMEGDFDRFLRMPGVGSLSRMAIHKIIQTAMVPMMRQNKDLMFQIATRPFGGYILKKILQVGRGCPVDCEFCSVSAFNGKRYRHYKIDQLVADIEELAGDGKGMDRFIAFADDNIVADPRFAKEFFRAIKPLKIKWWSQATIQMARDPELLRLAADSGCVGIFYGFETLKQDALKAVDKGFKVKDYVDVIKRTHDAGIAILTGAFVFGLPGDTLGDIERTVDFCIEHGIDFPQFTVLTPVPGTRLWNRVYGDAMPSEDYWGNYTYFSALDTPAIRESSMNAGELGQAWTEAYKKACSKQAVDKRLSKTAWSSAFVMGGVYFMNYLYTLFTEEDSWDSLGGRRDHIGAPHNGRLQPVKS